VTRRRTPGPDAWGPVSFPSTTGPVGAAPTSAVRAAAAVLALSVGLSVVLVVGAPAPARGESAAQARLATEQAAVEVDALLSEVEAALADYESSLDSLATGVTSSISADAEADAVTRQWQTQEEKQTHRVRALYMSGGPAAIYRTVLGADSPADVILRARSIGTLLDAGEVQVASARTDRDGAQTRADQLDDEAAGHVTTVAEVLDSHHELSGLLAAAEDRLAALEVRTAELETAAREAAERAVAEQAAAEREAAAAEEAARVAAARLAAQRSAARLDVVRSAVERVVVDAPARARARLAPADYRSLYTRAAATCPGLDATILTAIGQVESGHGRNIGPSSAGALGSMQFMPATFEAYGVDGNGDGVRDILDPADSVFSAANYLCASGAGQGPDGLRRALFAYNRAQWYVELVINVAGQLEAGQSS
jgi:peptidoglycan hydrolase CwlO-like protein